MTDSKVLTNCVHETAIIGYFNLIENHVVIGKNVFVGNNNTIREKTIIERNTMVGHSIVFEGETTIGRNCRIQSNSHITKGVVIGDGVFIGPGFVSCNDKKIVHLRHDVLKYKQEGFEICDGARIGSGVTFTPGIKIGKNALVGAGALVTKDVPDNEIWVGFPAKKVGEVPENERLKFDPFGNVVKENA